MLSCICGWWKTRQDQQGHGQWRVPRWAVVTAGLGPRECAEWPGRAAASSQLSSAAQKCPAGAGNTTPVPLFRRLCGMTGAMQSPPLEACPRWARLSCFRADSVDETLCWPCGITLFTRSFYLFCIFFSFSFLKGTLFIYFWLCWVFVSVRGLSPVAASGVHSSSRCTGLSLLRPLLLRSKGSRRAGSAVVAHGLSRSAACGILPDQGSNPCPLHWQADSQPLRHQGSPAGGFLTTAPPGKPHGAK